MPACPGPDVNQGIRSMHEEGVMLHHDDCIALVPKGLQDLEQVIGVFRVQTDAGFVQNVEGAHEARAQAGRQVNALGFSTAERGSRTI